ncbi:lysosomal proton-coupled steroid conjugate and bile acid symporter SLC46A3 [Oncorhynchus masou masou]|uniref:lysosomal proton-coupled steroid conjugate and bile acid symporter SLC46A3 n=1 Tax=Oncorhynchus masou masou TaxID=90313 RepID=UPI003183FE46
MMVRVFLIEPVVGVYAFSMFMLYPLIQQYVYRRLWQQLTGAPYPTQMNYTHCSDSSTNVSSIHQEIQKEASLFLFYSELCFLFPSLLSSLLLVSYSDHRGRKVALVPPLVGELLFALCYATVSHLSLSLGYLLGASFLAGVMGGPTALLGGSFAYIADLCEEEGVEGGGVKYLCEEGGGNMNIVGIGARDGGSYQCEGGRGGGGDDWRDRENDGQGDRGRDRESDGQGDRGRDRESDGQGDRGRDRESDGQGDRGRDRESDGQGDRGRDGESDGQGDKGRDGESDGQGDRDGGSRARDWGKGGGRTVRMAALEMLLGVLSGLASLCTGFYIQTAGFTWPFITAAVLHLINLVYTAWVLQETVERPSHTDSSSSPSSSPTPFGAGSARFLQREALIGRFQGVYLLFIASPRRRKTVLGLILAAFAFYTVSKLGGMSIFILYELNAPLCWSEVLVGYGSALSTLIYLGSFAGVSLLSRCLRDGYIVLLGLLSVAAGLLMAAFAKSTLLMFLVRLPLLLSIMPAPVLRSMMSKIVLRSEQGAVFACVAFVEMLSIGVGITVFSSTYASTVSWFPGFSFLLASAIALIPAVLIGVVMCLRLDKDEEASRLTADDDEEETESCGQSLQLPH